MKTRWLLLQVQSGYTALFLKLSFHKYMFHHNFTLECTNSLLSLMGYTWSVSMHLTISAAHCLQHILLLTLLFRGITWKEKRMYLLTSVTFHQSGCCWRKLYQRHLTHDCRTWHCFTRRAVWGSSQSTNNVTSLPPWRKGWKHRWKTALSLLDNLLLEFIRINTSFFCLFYFPKFYNKW